MRTSLWSRVRERRWTVVKALIGLGLLGAVVLQVDWAQFLDLIVLARPEWLAAAGLLVVFDRIIMGAKWRYLLRHMAVDIPLVSAVSHYFVASLVGIAVQWHVGGDIARATRASQDLGQHARIIGSIVIEKVVGVSALAFLSCVALILLNLRVGFAPPALLWAVLPVVALGSVGLPFVATSRRFATSMGALFRKLPFDRAAELGRKLPVVARSLDDGKEAISVFWGLTLFEQFVPPVALVLITHAYGEGISFLAALSVIPMISMLSRLPISIESIGVTESLYVFFLGLIGLNATFAFTLALTSRMIDAIVFASGATIMESLRARKGPVRIGSSD